MVTEQLKYPIGKYQKVEEITPELLTEQITIIASFPERLAHEVQKLSQKQLDTPYRNGGWTVRQVVHHCADSHMNSFIRFKLALTEDKPTIKPYEQGLWAELADSKTTEIEDSLLILSGLHRRWVKLLRSLSPNDLMKVFIHPETGKEVSVGENIGIYAWHCNHHLAHIINLKRDMKWPYL